VKRNAIVKRVDPQGKTGKQPFPGGAQRGQAKKSPGGNTSEALFKGRPAGWESVWRVAKKKKKKGESRDNNAEKTVYQRGPIPGTFD